MTVSLAVGAISAAGAYHLAMPTALDRVEDFVASQVEVKTWVKVRAVYA